MRVSVVRRVQNALRRRVFRPLLRLLQKGVSPQRLAWSLAVALVMGVNPLLGMTTVFMLVVAWVFRLDYVATQIGIHLMAPVQWLLFLPFIRAGILVFRSHELPLTKAEVLHLSQRHPLQTVPLLWQWEWHALVIWAVFAVVVTPVLAVQIRRVLEGAIGRHRELLVGV